MDKRRKERLIRTVIFGELVTMLVRQWRLLNKAKESHTTGSRFVYIDEALYYVDN